MASSEFLGYVCSLTPTLSVGVIPANLMHLEDELKKLDDTGVSIIHFDVMDGAFLSCDDCGFCIYKIS